MMIFQYHKPTRNSSFLMSNGSHLLSSDTLATSRHSLLTLAWNKGPQQQIRIDGERYDFPTNTILTLVKDQHFSFESPHHIVSWHFNRDFYCIVDHDAEVGCAGFLFYSALWPIVVRLDEVSQRKLDLLLSVFKDEFVEEDNIKGDMLLLLLKRLIIIVTRLAKKQFAELTDHSIELDNFREFNLLVENKYKEFHQVQDYADLMSKSAKTLSNTFKKAGHLSPLQVIHNRLLQEAKRMLLYTTESIKEITYELGFESPSQFSKFFKKMTDMTPQEYRNLP